MGLGALGLGLAVCLLVPQASSATKGKLRLRSAQGTLDTAAAVEGSSPPLETDFSTMHVVYASDSGSFAPLLHSMLSLSSNLGEPERCVIHLIVPEAELTLAEGLTECFRHEITSAGRAAPTVALQRLRPLPFNVSESVWPQLKGKATVFARFDLPDYLPGVRRALWIDTDTIIRKDVAQLYRTPMEMALAAKYEGGTWMNYVTIKPELESHIVNRDEHIFNSGVLLYNIPLWNAQNITQDLTERMQSLAHLGVDDQFVLNQVFRNKVHSLDKRWNLDGLGCWLGPNKTQIEEGWILHWSGGAKPWKGQGRARDIYAAFAPRENCSALA